jgi:hypothetical protein
MIFSKQFQLFREWFTLMVENDNTLKLIDEEDKKKHTHVRFELTKLGDFAFVLDLQSLSDTAIIFIGKEFFRIKMLLFYYRAQNSVNKEKNTLRNIIQKLVQSNLKKLYSEILKINIDISEAANIETNIKKLMGQ